MGLPKVIMHVDMDAFYASVELRDRPDLRGRPVIVGGWPRGVVLSATYEARAFGVRSGISSSQARRLAPHAIFLAPDFDKYTAVSKAIGAVFRSISPVVEAASIDEAFVDITGARRLFGSPASIGERVRAAVTDEQHITCSVGIGPNKFVAKIASRAAKPDGLVEVPPDGVVPFLHPLPVEAMWGVGQATTAQLHRLGLFTVADLAEVPPSTLLHALGPHGMVLHDLAWGRDCRRVARSDHERSMGAQETLAHDTDDPRMIRREILRLSDRVARRMRRAGLVGRTVSLGLRFADFAEVTRSARTPRPTNVTGEIYSQAWTLYERLRLDRPRLRRVGVRVEGLLDAGQTSWQPLLTEPEHGWREAETAVDAALGRFGPWAVHRASLVKGGAGRGPGSVTEL
jgi:DNA polymerase IV